MLLKIVNRLSQEPVTDERLLMQSSGLNPHMGYEDFGVQSDGTSVIFDRCGNFGYLDTNLFEVKAFTPESHQTDL